MKSLSNSLVEPDFDPCGTHLVEASAGTGKTHSLQTMYLRLVAIHGIPVERLLVVTFTDAATAELRERLRLILERSRQALEQPGRAGSNADADRIARVLAVPPRLGSIAANLRHTERECQLRRIRCALLDFDRAAIFTIHGFCRRALDAFAFECGQELDTETVTSDQLLRETCADHWRLIVYRKAQTLSERLLQAAPPTPEVLLAVAREIHKRDGITVRPNGTADSARLRESDAIQALSDAALWAQTERDAIVAELKSEAARPFFSDSERTPLIERLDRFREGGPGARDAPALALELRKALAPASIPNFVTMPEGVTECVERAAALMAFKTENRIRKAPRRPEYLVPEALRARWDALACAASNAIQRHRSAFESVIALMDAYPNAFKANVFSATARRSEAWSSLFPEEGAASVAAIEEVANVALSKRLVGWTPGHAATGLIERLARCEQALSRCADTQLAIEALAAGDAYERRKREAHVMTFDDMLTRLRRALTQNESAGPLRKAMRATFEAALIDEFQDTDPVQYDIFRRLFDDGATPLFFVGDPKQAIYAFRGGDIFTYRAAKERVDKSRRFYLDTNYRSQAPLVNAINAIFMNRASGSVFRDAAIEYPEPLKANDLNERFQEEGRIDERPFRIWNCTGSQPGRSGRAIGISSQEALHIYELVAEDVARLLNRADTGFVPRRIDQDDMKSVAPAPSDRAASAPLRRVRPSDIAILVRRHHEAALIHRALRKRGIPSVRHAGDCVFDADEALELAYLLAGAEEPGNLTAVRTSLASRLLPVGHAALAALARGATPSYAGEGRIENLALPDSIEAWVVFFRQVRALWERDGFIVAVNRIVSRCGVKAWLAAQPNGERALANLQHLIELLHTASAERQLGPAALRAWLQRQLVPETREDRADAFETRIESDNEAVRVMTIHKSKGLQFPIVYIPTLWSSIPAGNFNAFTVWHEERASSEADAASLESGAGKVPADRAPAFGGSQCEAILQIGADNAAATEQAAKERRAEDVRNFYVAATRALFRTVLVTGEMAAKAGTARECLPDERLSAWANAPDSGIAVERRSLIVEARVPVTAYTEGSAGVDPRGLTLPERPPCVEMSRDHASFSSIVGSGVATATDLAVYDVDSEDAVTESTLEPESGELTIFSFPAGARTGACWHSIFETLDFGADDEIIRAVVNAQLARYRLDDGTRDEAQTRRDLTFAMVSSVLRADLDAGGAVVRLADVPRGRRCAEMSFDFALRADEPRLGDGRNAIRRALETAWSGAKGDEARFLDRVRNWNARIPRGFMTGAIDLLFEHGGRYYVLDWKSNRLGGRPECFDREGLVAEMAEHAYFLQYLIYTVAVDRYLRQMLGSAYEYERDFGGVLYLFLRGIGSSGARGERRGVYFAKPDKTLVESLAEALMVGAC